MKPINAYLNIHKGKVVASTEKKPKLEWLQELDYWQSSILGEVENAELMDDEDPNPIIAVRGLDKKNVWLCNTNHPCQVEVKGKKVTVIRITPAAG